MKRKVRGGVLAAIGFILSPLSWWNDIFVNLPLSYIFAFPFGLISRRLFLPSMIIGYFLTNVIGLILLHYGAEEYASKEKRIFSRMDLIKNIIISLVYVLIVVLLVSSGWLKFPLDYFDNF